VTDFFSPLARLPGTRGGHTICGVTQVSGDRDGWLLVSEVAKRLGISASTVRRLGDAGELKRERDESDPNRAWLYDRQSVELYASRTPVQTGEPDAPGHGGETAARVTEALEQGCSPREIVIRLRIEPTTVAQVLRDLAELDAAAMTEQAAAERMARLEHEVAALRSDLDRLAVWVGELVRRTMPSMSTGRTLTG
jgi:hypothetical protein